MGDRRTARELALQALFYCDMEGVDPAGRLQLFCDNYKDLITGSVEPFFLDLVNGVIKFSEQVNNIISQSSKNWKVSRMPVVDRNIMRIAVYELLHRSDIPHSVTINEAV
ncbi:MAG: transcription antitermination factor NusB, partial [Desulfobacteraceae bacterium]|nr:transcription antitermination factor NusB [Desulfobacteraceae bacterium]